MNFYKIITIKSRLFQPFQLALSYVEHLIIYLELPLTAEYDVVLLVGFTGVEITGHNSVPTVPLAAPVLPVMVAQIVATAKRYETVIAHRGKLISRIMFDDRTEDGELFSVRQRRV